MGSRPGVAIGDAANLGAVGQSAIKCLRVECWSDCAYCSGRGSNTPAYSAYPPLSEDIVITPGRLSSRGATNTLLAMICALLALQLVTAHAEALLPRRLMAETARRAGAQGDGPQPVYLVSGPAGGRLDMLPVSVVYLDKNGSLGNAVGPDGSVRVRTIP